MCRGASAITAKTWSMKASGTASWNRSDMELTNTLDGVSVAVRNGVIDTSTRVP